MINVFRTANDQKSSGTRLQIHGTDAESDPAPCYSTITPHVARTTVLSVDNILISLIYNQTLHFRTVQRAMSVSSESAARHEVEETLHATLYPGTKIMADCTTPLPKDRNLY